VNRTQDTAVVSRFDIDGLTFQVCTEPGHIDAQAWDDLLAQQPHPTPFLRMAFLRALHDSGSATPQTGWAPFFITAHRADQPMVLEAACALYLKSHSYGEYVFDWAWAQAYERHGLAYYPKALAAIPFTPVPGSRLLARSDAARLSLLRAIQAWAQAAGLSSAHILFLDEDEARLAAQHGWMLRSNVQFHWQQRGEAEGGAWPDFDTYLESLQREKRKKIRQERRRVADAGVRFEIQAGSAISPAHWDFFYRCYTTTYEAHHSSPYLSRDFFQRMATTMAEHWVMFLAYREDQPIAASLVGLDPARRAAFGRYWGCTEPVDCLHFEACYYQPLQWCMHNGYTRFEGGAQGEHKMARGLLPTPTHSAHWLAHPQFAQAVADFLQREGQAIEAWQAELGERNPFKG
jgi:predicted N-acyltransferase